MKFVFLIIGIILGALGAFIVVDRVIDDEDFQDWADAFLP